MHSQAKSQSHIPSHFPSAIIYDTFVSLPIPLFICALCQISDYSMRLNACIINKCRLWLNGHLTHQPEINPTHQVVSVRDNPEWRRPSPAHKSHGLHKFMNLAMSYLGWKVGLHRDLLWGIPVWHCMVGMAVGSSICPHWLIDRRRVRASQAPQRSDSIGRDIWSLCKSLWSSYLLKKYITQVSMVGF